MAEATRSAGTPRLSIGLPVYNGENYLAAALGSLLDQDFRDFELIIADNASEDRTAEICRVFAAQDARIRYLQNDKNIGAAANYNLTLKEARGEYFKWAAHDDVCLQTFLSRCIEVLDRNDDVVLCHTLTDAIDEQGRVRGFYAQEQAFDQDTAPERFWTAISTPHICASVFGVMRREVLLKTIRHGDWVGADRNLLGQLCLFGKVHLVPEKLFRRREHAEASIHKFEDEAERLAWFDPNKSGDRSFPTWRRLREYADAIANAPLPFVQKMSAAWNLLRWVGARHHTGRRNASLLMRELMQR